jgi:hypothetical protein
VPDTCSRAQGIRVVHLAPLDQTKSYAAVDWIRPYEVNSSVDARLLARDGPRSRPIGRRRPDASTAKKALFRSWQELLGTDSGEKHLCFGRGLSGLFLGRTLGIKICPLPSCVEQAPVR